MGNLSSREWATIIWGAALFFYMIIKKEIRSSLYNLIKIFFSKKLRKLWIAYFLYISIITFLFSLLSFWKLVFIKDVMVWALFSGLIYFINALSKEVDETYFIKIIIENFRIVIIIEFITSIFTFNIFIELLIVPIFTIVFIMNYIFEKYIKYKDLYKLTDYLMASMGIIFLFKTIEVGINEYRNLNFIDTLISFMIPIIYLILTLPMMYFISLCSKYESLFLRMSFREGEDEKINKIHRFYVIKTCNISIKKVIIFTNEYLQRLYKGISEEEFNSLLNEFNNKY